METMRSTISQKTSRQGGGILDNLRVSWKLNLLAAFMVLGMISLFLVLIISIQSLSQLRTNLFDNNLTPLNHITQADETLASTQAQLISLQNKKLTPEERSAQASALLTSEQNLSEFIDTYQQQYLPAYTLDMSSVADSQERSELTNEFDTLQARRVAEFEQFTKAYSEYHDISGILIASLAEGTYNNELIQQSLEAISSARKPLHQMIDIIGDNLEILQIVSQELVQGTITKIILALVIIIAVAIFISSNVTRSISRRLQTVQNAAYSIEDGLMDLRSVINVSGNDEIATLARSFRNMQTQLHARFTTLEDQVAERTAQLQETTKLSEKRAAQFEAITQVSGAIASVRSLEDLLPEITRVISTQFGFYHVGIFLNDVHDEYSILSAANSEGGQRMLAREHRLRIGEQGIVGYVTQTGKPRIALDVGEDAIYFDNPDLPETRSEMALPLKIGDEIVGALDVQSTEPNAFSEEDISILSLLAEQVSLAIENARLFARTRRSLSEIETLYRQQIRQAWSRLLKEQQFSGFRYTPRGVSVIEDRPFHLQPDRGNISAETEVEQPQVSVPISIRGEAIGTLSVQFPESKDLTADQMDLIETVASRVSLAVENARLLEETSRRAERERTVSDITAKIRSANDPETMVDIALNELKSALGATQVQVVPHRLESMKDESIPEHLPLKNNAKKRKSRTGERE